MTVRSTAQLSPAERERVLGIASAARAADGVEPLSEQFRLDLRPGSGATHVLGYAAGRLTGYAQLVDPQAPDSAAELVVDPAARRLGLGTELLDHLPAPTRIWAHGEVPAATAFAAARGLTPVRELHKMALDLDTTDLPEPTLPAGLVVRAFHPGADDQAWVATNAAAFATHPEQGRLTVADLHQRMAQPWFDPQGFLLVVPDPSPAVGGVPGSPGPQPAAIAAFHWTKVEHEEPEETAQRTGEQRTSEHRTGQHEDEAATVGIGEVYVVGVHPAYQGRGLGRAVTLLGLHHLRERHVASVVLYVDGDNEPARRTYGRLGFVTVHVDRMYGRDATGSMPR